MKLTETQLIKFAFQSIPLINEVKLIETQLIKFAFQSIPFINYCILVLNGVLIACVKEISSSLFCMQYNMERYKKLI